MLTSAAASSGGQRYPLTKGKGLDAMEREALVVLCTPADVLARMRRSLPSPLDALSLPCSPQALTAFGVELILRAPNMRYHAVPSWGSGTPKGDDSP